MSVKGCSVSPVSVLNKRLLLLLNYCYYYYYYYCGLDLSNEAIRVAIGLRLGLDLCTPHQCQCGETADPRGHHGLVCRQSAGRSARHFAVNDLEWRALTKADTPCTKEPSGLIRTDGKRPDGATLVPWARGKYIAWDFTAIH